jgi:hypothetical protein
MTFLVWDEIEILDFDQMVLSQTGVRASYVGTAAPQMSSRLEE